jgi:hypothetical protein
MIIALHAQPRAGKDTLGKELIKHFGFVRFSFAGPLYEEVSAAFDAPIELLESDDWKKRPQKSLALINCADGEFVTLMLGLGFTLVEPLTSRLILQHWGTEYRRHQNKSYWTDKMWERLKAFFECGDSLVAQADVRAVITDTRVYRDKEGKISHDEAEVLKEFGWSAGVPQKLIEVVREGCEHTGHSSDDRFPVEMIDETVFNTSTPTWMLTQLTSYLQDEGLEKHLPPPLCN